MIYTREKLEQIREVLDRVSEAFMTIESVLDTAEDALDSAEEDGQTDPVEVESIPSEQFDVLAGAVEDLRELA